MTKIFGLLDGILKIFSGGVEYSYWYLFAYLGMIVMLPFLRKMAINFHKMELIYLLIFHFIISSLVPMINYISKTVYNHSFILNLTLPIMTERAIFYPLLGYYLDNILEIQKINKKQILLLTLITIAGILISSAFTYHQGINKKFTQDFVRIFDYITAIFVFILFKYLFINKKIIKSEKVNNIICKMGRLTFGMYLIDPFIRNLIYARIGKPLEQSLPILLVSFILCIISMTISGIITCFLRKMPLIKKIM